MAYAAVTVGIVGLFFVLLIAITSSLNRETERMHQQQVFSGDLNKLETLISQADRLAEQVASNNEILNVFIPLSDSKSGADGNYFDDQLMDTIRLDSLLSGINGVHGFADRISVLNRYGDYVSTGRLYETRSKIAETLSDTAATSALEEKVRMRDNHSLILGLHADQWSDNPNALLVSVFRTLSYTGTSEPYGLVSVQLQAERVTGLDFWGAEGEYMIVSDHSADAPELIYPGSAKLSILEVYNAVRGELAGDQPVYLSVELNGNRLMLFAGRISGSNWVLIRALSFTALTKPYLSSYGIMVLGCLVLMALLLIVVNYMAVRITRPLQNLTESIGSVNLQNMRLSTGDGQPSYSTHELIALDRSFREMLRRLDHSIALEMQAYMRVLQSQMNPHFLYNMLSVIIASSESAGDERTVSMCLKLTSMLRYVADFRRERLSLRDELEHVRNYLELMKERYEDLFSFEILADDEALDALVPKLTVQPLAENCFVHGFETEPPWHIRIQVSAEGGRFRLTVEDNGTGMSDDEIRSLTERIETYRRDVAGNYQELSLGGMGLVNTLLRLSLASGASIDYAISNLPEGGLRVMIGGELLDSRNDR